MTTETVITSNIPLEDFDKLVQEIADATGNTPDEVQVSIGDAEGTVRITRDKDGEIKDVQYGAEGGRRRSRLNKKTRRSKGRRRHSVRRKLRKLTSRRR